MNQKNAKAIRKQVRKNSNIFIEKGIKSTLSTICEQGFFTRLKICFFIMIKK